MDQFEFLISDESVNRYGFRVLTSGIRLDNFLQNPLMLYEHNFKESFGVPPTPIGRWENVRKEAGKLLGTAVFDMSDKFARLIANKVKDNFIRGASIHIDPITVSDDPSLMLEGQTGPTIVESELMEVSIVNLGGNKNAVKLGGETRLVATSGLVSLSSHKDGITEYEYLWKNGGLEQLKLSDPSRYNLLLAEFKGRFSEGRNSR